MLFEKERHYLQNIHQAGVWPQTDKYLVTVTKNFNVCLESALEF